MAKTLDADIDRLYQLPLDQFTSARNALARAAGSDGSVVKRLAKPPLAAWAVNQLYWDRRRVYDALVRAATEMRKAHKAVIEGRRGDLGGAGREHELALETALKSTLQLLRERQPATDATRHAVLNTLRALPGDEPPGRLSKALAPGGFEMLAGIQVPGSVGPSVRRSGGTVRTQGTKDPRTQGPSDREAAERAIRDAEHHARRAEFESARAVRDAAKAQKRVEQARAALERAREELSNAEREAAVAERDAAAAERVRESAERKARDAESALDAARKKAQRT